MGYWEFNKVDPSGVRIELTQRDQFNNDEVGLGEALVREVIQNSSDAWSGGAPVKVRFSLKKLSGSDAVKLAAMLGPLEPHMIAAGHDFSAVQSGLCRVLCIEDFNTKGLTGSFEHLDHENFDSFWRAVGKSEKTGQSGGRWGLGKLVYSSASQINVFFGVTRRKDDVMSYLMGQAVLAGHTIGDEFYAAHGFWLGKRSEQLKLQLPVDDQNEIAEFSKLMGLTRTAQTGLSIAIPYILDGINEDNLIAGVVQNYYFPILAGKLSVEIGGTVIDRDTFFEVASKASTIDGPVPLGFIKELSDSINSPPDICALKPIANQQFDDTFFTADDFQLMKTRFSAGTLVRARIPVVLQSRHGEKQTSHIDLFLKQVADDGKPYALFARSHITLPGEKRYFAGAPAMGALIATDPAVAGFLGDAENPAHTAWNAKAEKLNERWKHAPETLSALRHSLKKLAMLVADQIETRDDEALIDFFSIADQAQATSGKKKKTSKPKLDVGPREKAISIRARKGGFEILAGPAAAQWTFPRSIRVRVAYDMIGANPFNRHSRFDFDLEKGKEIAIEATGAHIQVLKPNTLKLTVAGGDFHLEATGFDERRDIVVDARAV